MNDSPDTDWEMLLSRDERARMLQDIAQVALTVGRHLFPNGHRDDLDIAAGSLLTRKSPVERLGFIARTLPALTQAMEQIACVPLTAPQSVQRPIAPPERARRVETQELLRSAQSGLGARRIRETLTTLSPDTPENRAVRSYLHTLQRDTAAIGRMADAADEVEIAQTAHQCASRLGSLLKRLSWDDVRESPNDWIAPPTHRMLSHPVYARLSHWMRRYRQDFGFDWETPLFQLPARETWRLYEAWGLFQTLGALLESGYEPVRGIPEEATALFAVKNDRLMFRLAKGEESGVTLRSAKGRMLQLYYNRTYPARQRSLSRTMQPDIAITEADDKMWLLDPKFKAYAAPGDEGGDIDQMHAYRDAIIDSEGRKPVQHAWCLYAGLRNESRPVISYGEGMAGVVGALQLRPGESDDFTRLCHLMAVWGIAEQEHKTDDVAEA